MKPFLVFLITLSLVSLFALSQKTSLDNYWKGNIVTSENEKTDSLAVAENAPWSVRMADSFIYRHPDYYINYGESKDWNYEQGLMLQALYKLYLKTENKNYYNYIVENLSHYITDNNRINTYVFSKFRLDDIAPGRALLDIYKAAKEEKYKIAADTLRKQLRLQPRTREGGFWHKEIYPHQMWLDGLFMAEPFYAQYAKIFNEKSDFNDIANQFILMYKHAIDPKTGLLYHGWDESKEQKWANPKTGNSKCFWGRGMGWYEMALVDVLDYFPKDNPQKKELINILQKSCKALLKYKDKNTGLWYQVLNKGNEKGNFLESSCSCMFVYAFAKGANNEYLDKEYYKIAENSYKGILNNFIKVDRNGLVNVLHACSGAGLGGNPYRDGSFEYYVSTPQRTNDFKAIGPFILASIQMEK
ncbi:MAG: glycoside hydrolase family 88 protein [Ignavibacteriaceae bacterium]